MEWFLVVIFVIAIYFLPGIVAHVRVHNDENSIVILNFFAGWTVVGWLAALIWSASGNVYVPVQKAAPVVSSPDVDDYEPCPECAEPVRKGAVKCRYCRCDIARLLH